MYKINFNSFPSIYWSTKTKIEYLQRRIIVAAIQYYEYDQSILKDNEYDGLSHQLVDLIKQSPKEFKKTRYYYCFKEFDGSTGFDLPERLNKANDNNPGGMSDYDYLHCIAQMVLNVKGN